MQLIILPEENEKFSLFRSLCSQQPVSRLIFDAIRHMNGSSQGRSSGDIFFPKSSGPEQQIVLPNVHCYHPLDTATLRNHRNQQGPDSWTLLTRGGQIFELDWQWLAGILSQIQVPLVTVQVCPHLKAYRERIQITSTGQIAGFRRLYADQAVRAPVHGSWPGWLFVRNAAFARFLEAYTALPEAFTEVLDWCEREGHSVQGLEIAGNAFDLNQPQEAFSFLRMRLKQLWPDSCSGYRTLARPEGTDIARGVRFFGNVLLGQDVRIHEKALIIGPVVLNDGVEIGASSVVRSCLLGEGVKIEEGQSVENQIVFDDTAKSEPLAGNDQAAEPAPARYVIGDSIAGVGPSPPQETFRRWHRWSYAACFKRMFDIIFSSLLLIFFAPVLPILVIAIKCSSSGPVFFKDKRQGLHGREFNCLKFRTMITGAESMQGRLRAISQVDGPQFKMEDDPRVTIVGRFLRDTCLDEIPQFFNVFLGQMSLIGPRPSPAAENQLCPSWRDARLSVRPGITGLWQISRTREEGKDFQEWIYFDTQYIRQMSFRLDAWIFWRTVKILVWDFLKRF